MKANYNGAKNPAYFLPIIRKSLNQTFNYLFPSFRLHKNSFSFITGLIFVVHNKTDILLNLIKK